MNWREKLLYFIGGMIVMGAVIVMGMALSIAMSSPSMGHTLDGKLVDRLQAISNEYAASGDQTTAEALDAILAEISTARSEGGGLLGDLALIADDFEEVNRYEIATKIRAIVGAFGLEPPPPVDPPVDCTDPVHATHEHCIVDEPPPPAAAPLTVEFLTTQNYLFDVPTKTRPLPFAIGMSADTTGPVTWEIWDWGDGWPIEAYEVADNVLRIRRHTYQTEGDFTMAVTIKGDDGQEVTITAPLWFRCYYGTCTEPGYVYPEPPP